MNLTTFIQNLNSKELVFIHNTVNPDGQIKKFADRATAEKRMLKIIAGNPDYITFHKANAAKLKADGIVIPAIEAPVPVPPVRTASPEAPTKEQIKARKILEAMKAKAQPEGSAAPKATRAPKEGAAPAKKQNTPPHLNVRCACCGYYAKTTPAMMQIARLKCPVDPKHGNLLTAEERGENRGR